MIIKYVHNGNMVCTHFENEQLFLKECYKPEFRDILFNSKNIIVLENNGHNYSCDNMLEVYRKYKNFVIN